MPEHSTVETTLSCKVCGFVVAPPGGMLGFVWGATPEHYRRMGENVRWHRDARGMTVPSMRIISRGGGAVRFNFGSPTIEHVLVFEGDSNVSEFECGKCQTRYPTAAVEIAHGVLSAAHLFGFGE